ncbi:MAG: Flp pilus assembly protein TadD [Glaciecola sp.]|jgi:Flp pilus assembly protein TadD
MKLAHFEFDPKRDLLGEGPLSEVYRARDTRLDREVALKILRPQVEIDPQADQRFYNEARHTVAAGHPGITTIYEYAKLPDGPSYIAMEFLQGRTLEKIISERTMNFGECLRIALALTDALSAVHNLGMIHRDLKPANVMQLNDGGLKLLDFGIARASDEVSITQHGMLVGTVLYMSPEQVRGEPLDARSDIFSLGAMLYQITTGALPYPGQSFPEVCMAILDGEPRLKPSQVRQGFPPALEQFLMRCLERDPAERFADGAKAHDALLIIQHQLTAQVPITLRGRLLLPPVQCAKDDPCHAMAGALRKDLAADLDRNKGLKVKLVDTVEAEPDDFVLQTVLRVTGSNGRLELSLSRADAQAQAANPKTKVVEAQDTDEWALQESLVRGAARFVRSSMTRGFDAQDSPQVKQALAITRRARLTIHKGTSKHLLFGVSMLRKALELDRFCATAHAVLAEAKVRKYLYWEGDPSFLEEAREHAARALTLDPQCPEAHTALGFAYHLSNHGEEARREYRLAIRLSSGEWFAQRLLGTMLTREGNLQHAEEALRQAIRLRPQYIACYDHMYRGLRHQGRHEEAQVIAEQGIQAALIHLANVPDDLESLLHMGFLQARLGQTEAATASADKALELAPKDGYTHFNVATIRALIGETGSAIDALRTAQDRGYYIKSEILGNTDLDALRGIKAFDSLAS